MRASSTRAAYRAIGYRLQHGEARGLARGIWLGCPRLGLSADASPWPGGGLEERSGVEAGAS
ncbi:hypothetical protein DAI22_09g121100 [Oryza sativa Japonica Group]|uniref:Uncharacterized protein n=1 Tax=Oryza sativa subsp. japonica TaxID=39947 RepID=Q67UG9_ORYSJ|nr:hypothetical protein DAI22_09g121100 [Oryza sativa Japonica Group]BAD38200.1 hypothetical protein [Oryza sativa Japonica Group]